MRRGCRVVLSREGRAFRKSAIARLSAGPRPRPGGCPRTPLTERLAMRVVLHPPNRRGFDIDNRIKALADALEHAGIYENDGQIDHLEIDRGTICPGGCAEVEITCLTAPESENEDDD